VVTLDVKHEFRQDHKKSNRNKIDGTIKVVSDVAAALPSSNKCGFVGAEATDFLPVYTN
jgi:hypothetical protein